MDNQLFEVIYVFPDDQSRDKYQVLSLDAMKEQFTGNIINIIITPLFYSIDIVTLEPKQVKIKRL